MMKEAQAEGRTLRMVGSTLHEADTAGELLRWANTECSKKEPFFGVYYTAIPHVPYEVYHAPELKIPNQLPDVEKHARLVQMTDDQARRIWEDVSTWDCGRPFTLVVTGDHGEAFQEHAGNRWHAEFNYQENLHVPLLMISKQFRSGQSQTPTDHVDLSVTLAHLVTGQVQKELKFWGGRTLMQAVQPKPLFSVALLNQGKTSVRWGNWKWINKPTGNELFDLNQDPLENNNIKEEYPDISKTLDSTLLPWTQWVRNYAKQRLPFPKREVSAKSK